MGFTNDLPLLTARTGARSCAGRGRRGIRLHGNPSPVHSGSTAAEESAGTTGRGSETPTGFRERGVRRGERFHPASWTRRSPWRATH